MDEVLNYRLGESAGGLWRRLWALGFNPPPHKWNESARQWLDRTAEVRDIIKAIKTGRLNDANTDTQH